MLTLRAKYFYCTPQSHLQHCTCDYLTLWILSGPGFLVSPAYHLYSILTNIDQHNVRSREWENTLVYCHTINSSTYRRDKISHHMTFYLKHPVGHEQCLLIDDVDLLTIPSFITTLWGICCDIGLLFSGYIFVPTCNESSFGIMRLYYSGDENVILSIYRCLKKHK